MENILNASRKPLPFLTLQELAATKVTTTLCNNPLLLSAIMDFNDVWQFKLNRDEKEWGYVISMASELFSKISTFIGLKKIILKLLWPVSYKMMAWKTAYAPTIKNQYLQFFWESPGKIDNLRTVRYIMRTKNVPIRDTFTLACNLCLSKEILELWIKMSDKDRFFFQEENLETISPLLIYWIRTVSTTSVKDIFLVEALEWAMRRSFFDAVKYLLNILNFKSDMATMCFDYLLLNGNKHGFLNESEIDVAYFVFPHMCYNNQLVVFGSNSLLTLCLTLHSSSQEIFLNEFKDRLPFLSVEVIRNLLFHIFLYYYMELTQDQDYYELFVNVWQTIPVSVKTSFTGELCLGTKILKVLVKTEWQHLFVGDSEKSTSGGSSSLVSLTPYCFSEDRWDLVYFLIQEEIVTIPSLTKQRDVFLSFLNQKNSQVFCKSV